MSLCQDGCDACWGSQALCQRNTPKRGLGQAARINCRREICVCLSPTRCWAWMSQSVRRSQKEKMHFSQCQQEMKLGGSWSCVFANGENWIRQHKLLKLTSEKCFLGELPSTIENTSLLKERREEEDHRNMYEYSTLSTILQNPYKIK